VKLGSLRSGGRDGTLVVVDRNLERAAAVPRIAPTLQAALDAWADVAPELRAVYRLLNQGSTPDSFAFDPARMASPLPRAHQWADGSAYLHHVELVRRARGASMPESFLTDPLMYQGGSDGFLGPCESIPLLDDSWGLDFEAEVAVITDDVPLGVSPAGASAHIKLVLLVNDVSLRNLIPGELAKGFGFFQSKPASAFSPVAVSPDELGAAWDGGRLHMPLLSYRNGELFGRPNAGVDMNFDFPTLIAHAARTRSLGAGSIIGAGTVSNRNREVGSSCIAEKRMLEIIDSGAAQTAFLRHGERVRIEMLDANARSIFGAIDQTVERRAVS
jgi:fumarylacetoacetate (FAA) hydrolase